MTYEENRLRQLAATQRRAAGIDPEETIVHLQEINRDLLEALETIVELPYCCEEDSPQRIEEIQTIARAAIAKAKSHD